VRVPGGGHYAPNGRGGCGLDTRPDDMNAEPAERSHTHMSMTTVARIYLSHKSTLFSARSHLLHAVPRGRREEVRS
jgi:hypothetical protein